MKAQPQWLFETPPTTQPGKFDLEGNFNSVNWKTSSDWLFESSLPSTPAYTQCDFIDPRIDVDAQYALFEMLKGDISTRTAAISMFSAVKNGSLGGIYKENQQVPAKRAQRIGKTWWTLIPSGQSAICVTLPPSEPPIIVFKKLLTNRFQLGQALRTAWSTCGVLNPTPYPPSGKVCPNRPKPPVKVPPSTKKSCNNDQLIQELQKCQQQLEQCYEKCSTDMSTIVGILGSFPAAATCLATVGATFNPLGIAACLTAAGVPAAKGLIDEYFRLAKCRQNCEFALQMCKLNAEVSSGCLKT